MRDLCVRTFFSVEKILFKKEKNTYSHIRMELGSFESFPTLKKRVKEEKSLLASYISNFE